MVSVIVSPEEFLPVGSVVVYLFLLLFTLLLYICRYSKVAFPTLFFILATALLGTINGACSLYYNMNQVYGSGYNFTVILPSVIFSLIERVFTWMAGITVFSTFFKEKKKTFIYVAYLITLIEVILSIVAVVFYSKILNATSTLIAGLVAQYNQIYTAYTALKWVYFLLFIILLVQTKDLVPRFASIILIIFLVLNTVVLIVHCVYLNSTNESIYFQGYAIFIFFFTDFLSVISLLLIVTYWRRITSPNEQINDN